MRKNKLFAIIIICLGLVTACTDQGNDNLKGNKSAIEDTGNSEIEEKADAAYADSFVEVIDVADSDSTELEDKSDTAGTSSTKAEDNALSNEESSEEDSNNTNKYAHEAFQTLLGGDFNLLDLTTVDGIFVDDITENGWGGNYEFIFMDLDGDEIDELLIQMVDDPGDFNAVFHYDNGQISCWFCDTLEYICYDYPLQNGTMVTEYDYGGGISYHVFNYLPTGDTEDVKYFYIKEEPYTDYDDPSDFPIYQIDNEDVTKEEFEKELNEYVLDEQMDRTDWTILD